MRRTATASEKPQRNAKCAYLCATSYFAVLPYASVDDLQALAGPNSMLAKKY